LRGRQEDGIKWRPAENIKGGKGNRGDFNHRKRLVMEKKKKRLLFCLDDWGSGRTKKNRVFWGRLAARDPDLGVNSNLTSIGVNFSMKGNGMDRKSEGRGRTLLEEKFLFGEGGERQSGSSDHVKKGWTFI